VGQSFPDVQGVPHTFSICHADQMSTNLNCMLCCKSERGKDIFSVVCEKHHHSTNTHSCKIKCYTTSSIPYLHIKIRSCFMTPGDIYIYIHNLSQTGMSSILLSSSSPIKYRHMKKTNIFSDK